MYPAPPVTSTRCTVTAPFEPGRNRSGGYAFITTRDEWTAVRSSTSRRRWICGVRSRGWLPTKKPRSWAVLAFTISPTVS